MPLMPPVILLVFAVALGLYLGYGFLQRRRNRPALIAFHVLAGIGALELIAMALHGAPDGTVTPTSTFGKWAALLLVITAIVGLLTPILFRNRPRNTTTVSLTIHGLLASTALTLLIIWVWTNSQRP